MAAREAAWHHHDGYGVSGISFVAFGSNGHHDENAAQRARRVVPSAVPPVASESKLLPGRARVLLSLVLACLFVQAVHARTSFRFRQWRVLYLLDRKYRWFEGQVARLMPWSSCGDFRQVGLTCDTSGNVIAIDRPRSSIAGSVPSHVSRLNHLRRLDLSGNLLTGSLPSTFGRWPSLTYLNISSNSLTGSLPDAISRLSSLQLMYLQSNAFTGSLPDAFSPLQKLKALFLWSNSFSGTLPKSLGSLASLTYMSLHTNSFTGGLPPSFSGLTSLRIMDLHSNSFDGGLPDAFTPLQSLEFMSLWGNSFSGALPQSLGALASLTYMGASLNSFSGSLPASLSGLTSLLSLDLHFNSLSGSLPDAFGSLKQLHTLKIWCNAFSGTLPASLGSLASLTYMGIFSNFFSGSLPASFSTLTRLRILDLHNNSFIGPLPDVFSGMQGLQFLSLWSNSLSGSLPSSLGTLASLTYMGAFSNALSGSLPSTLSGLSSLQLMNLHYNSFTGSLPDVFSGMQQLRLLRLWGNSLTGTLPASLGSLASLSYLGMFSNSLTGSLPSSFSGLTSARVIDLHYNALTGPLPDAFAPLQQLQFLSLWKNNFSNALPDSLGSIASLSYLGLSSNNFSGSLPPNLSGLSNLQIFDLHVNSLSGSLPDIFSPLQQLRTFKLWGNSFQGSLPASIGSLAALTYLGLFHNSFVGNLPASLSGLTSLQIMDLYLNAFTGSLPDIFSGLQRLKMLRLWGNSFSGSLPASIGSLASLSYLGLFSNYFNGSLPASLSALSDLQVLDLHYNGFTGSLPSSLFSNMQQLKFLSMWSVPIEGSLPASMGNLASLSYLGIFNNYLSGSIPSTFSRMSKLKSIDLHYNAFSGSLPEIFDGMQELQFLRLWNNSFSGSLPSSLGGLASLRYLGLSSNIFSGSVPESLSRLTNLQILRLHYNSFTGSLPSSFGSLKQLKQLTFWDNAFTGSLPASISDLAQLTYFSIARNGFSGSIPDALSALTNLQHLILSNNFLTGSIPVSLSRLTKLKQFYLSANQLDGAIPPWLGSFTGLEVLFLSINKFSGTIPAQALNLPALKALSMGVLQVTGPIPEVLSSLTSLTYLDAGFSRFTGALPSLHIEPGSRIFLQGNFFRSYSSAFLSGVCSFSGSAMVYVDTNCLPAEPSTPYCNQLQRSEDFCNATCSSACGGIDACFVMDSSVPACPCGATQYSSALNPGACNELQSPTISFCLSPSNLFLQSFLLTGSASLTSGAISFALPSSSPALGSAFLPSPISLFSDDTCNSPLSFSISFTLHMDNTQNSLEGGLTFALLASTPSSLSYTPGGLGYAGTGVGLAVEFDTSKESWDPSSNHVGINIGGSVNSIATAAPPFSLHNGQPTYVWIAFDGSTIEVFAAQGTNTQPAAPLLSLAVDLCGLLRPLPLTSASRRFYAGFTAQSDCTCLSQRVVNWCITTGDPTTRSNGLSVQPSALFPLGTGNALSRHTSSGYSPALDGSDSWLISTFFTWNTTAWLPPVHDQAGCAACWAYATVDSIASAYAILANNAASSPPLLPAAQLFNTPADSFSPCSPSCPATALQYVANISTAGGGLVETGGAQTYPIVSFERVSFFGWFGLLLAVQHQPVMVHIQADAPSFLAYDGSYVYNDESCYSYSLNHVVLVVGYLIAGKARNGFLPPFWILKNSWGSEWGNQGFVRMGITGGDGICGINVLPGLYPVLKTSDPCLSSSLPTSTSLPSLNPCGGFTCHTDPANSTTNTCDCTAPFVQATNGDGSRTCVYVDRCFSDATNPCKVGTCRNTGDGSYTCICPHGFYVGPTYDGSPTCSPSDYSVTTTSYTVVTSQTSADDIAGAFGISLAYLRQINPTVSFNLALTPSTVLNVTPPVSLTPCSVFYTVVSGDYCYKIWTLFGLSSYTFASLNPGIDCNTIYPGSITCVERSAVRPAAATAAVPCSQPYVVRSSDTCDSVRSKVLASSGDASAGALSWTDFYRYNPGINCDNLFPPSAVATASPVELCLAVSGSFSQGGCGARCYLLALPAGATCSSLMSRYFANSPSKWSLCNPRFPCVDPISTNRRTVCVPK